MLLTMNRAALLTSNRSFLHLPCPTIRPKNILTLLLMAHINILICKAKQLLVAHSSGCGDAASAAGCSGSFGYIADGGLSVVA